MAGLHLLDAGRLYAARDADPDVRATGLTLARGGVVHSIDGGLEQRRIIAAVVGHRPAAQTQIAGGVRHLLWLDQVAATDFNRIEMERLSQTVHQAFDDEVADLTAAAANESGRDRVGVEHRGMGIERRQAVGAHHVTEDVVALAEPRATVGADVVLKPDSNAAERAVRIGGQLGICHVTM